MSNNGNIFEEQISLSQVNETVELPKHGSILCCLCGISIPPNPAAMCLECLKTQIDITEGIQTKFPIVQCKTCGKFHHNRNSWVYYELESSNLLTFILKKVPGLVNNNNFKVNNTKWIWTEPHSKRLKILINLTKFNILERNSLNLTTNVLIEIIIKNKLCPSCVMEATDHNFKSLVQIRLSNKFNTKNISSNSSNTSNMNNSKDIKKLFYTLENLLTKYKLYNLMYKINIIKNIGFNFYFLNKNHGERVIQFILSNFPCRIKHSKKLISKDTHTNTAKFEFTTYIEIVNLNKNDLIVPHKNNNGGKVEFFLVNHIYSLVHLINPYDLAPLELSATQYFLNTPFLIASEKNLVPFIILDITIVDHIGKKENPSFSNLYEATIAREEDIGDDSKTYQVLTHLGHLFQAGDIALVYDLRHLNLSPDEDNLMKSLTNFSTYSIHNSVNSSEVPKEESNLKSKKSKIKKSKKDENEEDSISGYPYIIIVKKGLTEEEKREKNLKKSKKRNRQAPWRIKKETEEDEELESNEIPKSNEPMVENYEDLYDEEIDDEEIDDEEDDDNEVYDQNQYELDEYATYEDEDEDEIYEDYLNDDQLYDEDIDLNELEEVLEEEYLHTCSESYDENNKISDKEVEIEKKEIIIKSKKELRAEKKENKKLKSKI